MDELLNHIVKRNGKYLLISRKGKVLGTHDTREDAERQERAVERSKHMKDAADTLTVLLAGVIAGQKLLAEQDRDDHGRFSGPGGGGGEGGGGYKPKADGGYRPARLGASHQEQIEHHDAGEKYHQQQFVKHMDESSKALQEGGWKGGHGWQDPSKKQHYIESLDKARMHQKASDKHRKKADFLRKNA